MPARLRATPQSPRSKQRSVAAAKSQAGAKSRAKRARASAATAKKSRARRTQGWKTSNTRTPARRGTTPAYGEGSGRDYVAVGGTPVGGGARTATAIKSGARRRSKGEAALNRELKRRQASRGTSRKSQARAYGNVPMRRKPKPDIGPSLGRAGAAPRTPRTDARRAAVGTAAKDRARRRAPARRRRGY